MWINRLLVWSILTWIVSFIVHAITQILQYSAAKLFQLRFHLSKPPPALHHLDIAHHARRKYIHRGSRRSCNFDDTKPIRSFCSSNPRPARRSTGRSIDHSSLANLARVSTLHKTQ
ncbi:Protease HtpX like [Dissostichus eleginoides]|uniref:Protease HtpX like n=1 Tax=Dissostichus eleginoides TaxID=100907 RepID=A0AAD9C1F0_DISEL|nr:Protease HtpX like [Dissostichus eleginoides]